VNRLTHMSGHAIDIEVDPALVRANEVRTLVGSPDRLHAIVGPLPDFPFDVTLKWLLQ